MFCECLSLFAKLFLDTKSVCYDVEGFLFYILAEQLPDGKSHVVGFFSKERCSWDQNNLACLSVFPPFQKRGLGKLLIAFSYELSKREKKIGSPEKRELFRSPMSNMSLISAGNVTAGSTNKLG